MDSTASSASSALPALATDASLPLAAGATIPGEGEARAYWLEESLLAWPASLLPPGVRPTDCTAPSRYPLAAPPVGFGLLCSPSGGSRLVHGVLKRGEHSVEVPLGLAGNLGDLRPDLVSSYPQLADYLALTTVDEFGAPRLSREDVEIFLTGQVMMVQRAGGPGDWVTAFTGVQIWPIIDHLWGSSASARDGSAPLGAFFPPDAAGLSRTPTFTLWAPTAQNVHLLTWNTGDPTGSMPLMAGEPTRTQATRLRDGRWEVSGAVSTEAGIEEGCQYLWEVTVYVPATGRVERNLVTDPYSAALTVDSRRSVAVDLDRPELAPDVWSRTASPVVTNDAARVIYELHLRDFSAADHSVPEELRGTYAAFGVDSAGTRRLAELVEAGVDTIHLLPICDFSTVPEDPSARREPLIPDNAGPASPSPQAAVGAVADADSYNWGYDPWHWMCPEGSYAPAGRGDGGARVAAVREMVGHLHALGLQVVLDQVFNHTAAAGQDPHSVLDRIVPGYYHRLDAAGRIETSACGTNVATERALAERLMIDACVRWVRDYRVDGLRFDLMGYHSVDTMKRLRQAVNEVACPAASPGRPACAGSGTEVDRRTGARAGVGHPVFLYGEGWDMGEVAGNRLFRQAIQGQVGDGLHVATFNDRVRDAVVGPQFGVDPRAGQGFGSGAAGDPAGWDERDQHARAGDATWRADLVRLSLAGNLRGLEVPVGDRWGRSEEIGYGDSPAAYADEPVDALAYVSSHDNETLFDRLAYKLPLDLPMRERVRMNTLCLAAVTLGQSPVFWSAGVEALRSKSLDRDSYNSGDRFNAIDWDGLDNGWGRGLPPAWRNFDHWVIQAALLARPDLRPGPADIAAARTQALDLLRVRRSTPLLTLGSAALVRERVSFPHLEVVGLPETWEDWAGQVTGIAWAYEATGDAGTTLAATSAGLPLAPELQPRTEAASRIQAGCIVVMVIDDGAGDADLDPAADGAMVALNPYGWPVAVRVRELVGRRFQLSAVQAEGADPVIRAARFDAGTGVLTLPGRSAAVMVEN